MSIQCDAPEHDEPDNSASFCVLDAWHEPEMKPEVDDGFAYIDGHKFEDLLYACNELTINRLKDEGDNDLASFVTFDNAGRIHCEVEPLKEIVGVKIPYSGGGTCFGEGLRVANEVLSRNNFEQF
ncbi:hypothetical protein PPTG_18649 [Phytophthora nicotianae INRA-310]|uniref:Uncharacterized protein n=1 Tax=Phytophthora nicotianae (strain INRA-310) TaxID=761204 RepID=W2PFC6_PHYN3|nr:hypothetical protein PPTG_18649 [Phytophthora nicotianae INRA-310]ETM99566.1 hypothetical protein PPTG_18649 [Phytophthora nicotianae INRA-310]